MHNVRKNTKGVSQGLYLLKRTERRGERKKHSVNLPQNPTPVLRTCVVVYQVLGSQEPDIHGSSDCASRKED